MATLLDGVVNRIVWEKSRDNQKRDKAHQYSTDPEELINELSNYELLQRISWELESAKGGAFGG